MSEKLLEWPPPSHGGKAVAALTAARWPTSLARIGQRDTPTMPEHEKSRATEADHLRQLQRALDRAKAGKRERQSEGAE